MAADQIAREALALTRLQLDEVRRRIAEVESGAVTLIPGDEALAQVRSLVANQIAQLDRSVPEPRPGSDGERGLDSAHRGGYHRESSSFEDR
ncbi:MAG TPA: addiction module protein [Thermoanaerobaculia bacterium]|nr:addiction module protein [Thermoanaerobaculia bacterium]